MRRLEIPPGVASLFSQFCRMKLTSMFLSLHNTCRQDKCISAELRWVNNLPIDKSSIEVPGLNFSSQTADSSFSFYATNTASKGKTKTSTQIKLNI